VKEEVMARSDARYSVYPAPKAIEVVGNTAPALNQAIECWAALQSRAMAENARIFSESDLELTAARPDQHPLHDWAVLANVIQDKRFEPDFPKPGDLLAAAVEDAHTLEGIGDEWYFADESNQKNRDAAVGKLAQELRKLDYARAWAVIGAVQWFWEHCDEGIDIKKDPWWTLAFRRQWYQTKAKKSHKRRSTHES
jgi:hypothetical protein